MLHGYFTLLNIPLTGKRLATIGRYHSTIRCFIVVFDDERLHRCAEARLGDEGHAEADPYRLQIQLLDDMGCI